MTAKAILAIVVGYGAGLWFSVLAWRKQAALERAKGWLTTRGRILEATLYQDPQRNATHFRIRYVFQVGNQIEGNTPRLSGDWFWNSKQQAAFVSRFTPGQEVEVFYDPRDPTRNCLDHTDRSGIWAMWVIALGGTILATLLVWLGRQ
jgi:hypothetical protein